jgi:hypothetical protein
LHLEKWRDRKKCDGNRAKAISPQSPNSHFIMRVLIGKLYCGAVCEKVLPVEREDFDRGKVLQ